MGGKVGSNQSNAAYSNSVISMDLKYIVAPWLAGKDGTTA